MSEPTMDRLVEAGAAAISNRYIMLEGRECQDYARLAITAALPLAVSMWKNDLIGIQGEPKTLIEKEESTLRGALGMARARYENLVIACDEATREGRSLDAPIERRKRPVRLPPVPRELLTADPALMASPEGDVKGLQELRDEIDWVHNDNLNEPWEN